MKVKNLNNHIQHIVTGYKQQATLYVKLLQMAQRLETILTAESAMTDEGDTAGGSENLSGHLQQIMSDRSRTIDDIIRLDEDIRPHREAVMNILHLKEFDLSRVQDLIHADLRKDFFEQQKLLEKLIIEIMETDRKNETVLNNRMQDVAAELKKIKQHHRIQQTYLDRPEKYPEPRFIDSKK